MHNWECIDNRVDLFTNFYSEPSLRSVFSISPKRHFKVVFKSGSLEVFIHISIFRSCLVTKKWSSFKANWKTSDLTVSSISLTSQRSVQERWNGGPQSAVRRCLNPTNHDVAFHGFRNAIKIWGQNSGCDRDLVDAYCQHGLKGLDRSTFLEQLNPHNTMFEHSVHSLGSSSK